VFPPCNTGSGAVSKSELVNIGGGALELGVSRTSLFLRTTARSSETLVKAKAGEVIAEQLEGHERRVNPLCESGGPRSAAKDPVTAAFP